MHRSWHGGRRGRPRAVLGEGVREGLAWRGKGSGGSVPGGVGGRGTGPKHGANFEKWRFLKDALWGGGGTHRSWALDSRGRGQGRVGLSKASGRVGGGGTGPHNGANFATFLTGTKRSKMAFFEGCPVGWGGAGVVDGGVDQGP